MPPWQSATYSSDGDRTLATYIYNAETVDDRKNDLDKLDYGNGDSVEYEYDDKGRVTKQTYFEGATEKGNVTYTYDNDGALAKVTDSATGITTTYYYDLTGRTMKYVESASGYSHSVGYEYDTLNNLTQQVETINGVNYTSSYTYDNDNRVETVTTDGVTVEYDYDAFGRVLTQTTKNGSTLILTESYTYKNPTSTTTSAQIATYTTTAPNGYSVTYSYTYDNNGNIISISDGTNTTTYVYDSANQLIRENNQAAGYTYTWIYDNAGNILRSRQFVYTTGEPTQQVNTMRYDYEDDQWRDLLTAYDGTNITNDAIGNPLYDGLWTYTWEHGRELVSMSDGTTTWTFTYDANGMRTGRTNGIINHSYVYNGSQLSQMTADSNTLNFTYDASGTPLTVNYNGTTYYYATNLQGDVVTILNASRAAVVEYTYNAWGELLSTTGTLASTLGAINPLRYRGYVYDTETELYYLQSRYYSPLMCRFINADAYVSTGQGLVSNNMFVYCYNNPVKFSDSSGDLPVIVIIITTGIVALGALLMPTRDDVKASAENHYSRNERNKTTEDINEILREYNKQAEWADKYHENTDGTQGDEAIYNDKYLSPKGGHNEIIICSPPGKDPYIVDETVDAKNMGTYNYAANYIPGVYHAVHFFLDMVPYYFYGNTKNDDVGLLKWALD